MNVQLTKDLLHQDALFQCLPNGGIKFAREEVTLVDIAVPLIPDKIIKAAQ